MPKLTPRQAKKMIKAKAGKNYSCPQCCSKRIKHIINPDDITDTTLSEEIKCKKCGWSKITTLNLVKR